ncbi:MAG: hypothetical protein ACO23V_06680 [Chitinophagaceae bacterium]
MHVVRNHIAFKIFWLLMAFHILNISVDAPDPQPNTIPEDLNYNDMESIVEVVLEQAFELDNFIAEHDENDSDDLGDSAIKKNEVNNFYSNSLQPLSWSLTTHTKSFLSLYIKRYINTYSPQIILPPPKC